MIRYWVSFCWNLLTNSWYTEPCQWQTWSNWDQCSKSCNNGTTTRIRKIIKKASKGGSCPGQRTETKSCNEQGCPGMYGKLSLKVLHAKVQLVFLKCLENCAWSTWSSYSQCSKTCGPGSKYRTRKKVKVEKNGGTCLGSGRDSRSCNVKKCPGTFFKRVIG